LISLLILRHIETSIDCEKKKRSGCTIAQWRFSKCPLIFRYSQH